MRLWEAIHEVQQLATVSNGFIWDDRLSFGIDPEAWERIEEKKINPLLIFCHPRVLSEQPRLLVYYRTVALLSQKGFAGLVRGNLAKIESGGVERLDAEWLERAVVAVNSVLSAIVKTAADIEERDLPGFQFASAGFTNQGSWNNEIGAEGERAVKTILVNHLRNEIVQLVWRDGSSTPYSEEMHPTLIDRIQEVKVARLKDGYHLLFSSEPDVSLRDPKDIPLVAMEVKAGFDSAGALERLGAGMKSFENDRNINPRVKTVYVVRCLTPEVQRRISQGNLADHTFGLAELLVDSRTQQTFSNLILRVILGKKSK